MKTRLTRSCTAATLGYLRRRLPDGEENEAEDLAENALMLAAVRRNSFNPAAGTFRSWLYAIAANQRRDYLRMLSRKLRGWLRETVDDEALARAPDPTPSSAQRWYEREVVREALAELTQRQRDVVLLSFWQGFTYGEIGRILGIRRGSVGAHRDRALKRLRAALGAELSERPALGGSLEPEGASS